MGVASRFPQILRNMAWRSHGSSNSDLIEQLKGIMHFNALFKVEFLTLKIALI